MKHSAIIGGFIILTAIMFGKVLPDMDYNIIDMSIKDFGITIGYLVIVILVLIYSERHYYKGDK